MLFYFQVIFVFSSFLVFIICIGLFKRPYWTCTKQVFGIRIDFSLLVNLYSSSVSLTFPSKLRNYLSDTTTAQPIAEARPKRQPKVPFKLQDFVREWWCNRLQHLNTLQDIMLNLLFTIIAIMFCCAVKFVRENIVLSSLLERILCCKVCAENMFCL